MQFKAFLAVFLICVLLVNQVDAQAIDTSFVGLFAYINVGQSINLTKFNTIAQVQTASGLFPLASPFVTGTNFTEGEVFFVGGDTSNGNYCAGLPLLMEDGVDASERNLACTTRYGFVGGNYEHSTGTSTTINGCSGTCSIFRVRVRVRSDGWVMAYHYNSQVPPNNRAALLRWRKGGRGITTAAADDIILGTTIERTLVVLNSSGSITTPVAYSPGIVQYYDFNHTNATSILIFGTGRPNNGYIPGTYGFGFRLNSTTTIVHASASRKARVQGNGISINGLLWACTQGFNGGNQDSTIETHNQWKMAFGVNGTPLTSCPSVAADSNRGDPFFAGPINTTAFLIQPGVYSNVTAGADDLKMAFLFYLR